MPLRLASGADAPTITHIFQAARRAALPFLPILHTDAEDHAFFASLVARGGVTVAERDGEVLGFLVLHGDTVEHLYIRPDVRRTGLGGELLRAAQSERERLGLWVFQRNAPAIAFYEAHGFAIERSTDGRENEEREPDHWMTWSLR